MKKALLGTTALVAGGLFASAAVAADLIPVAPEPVEEGFTLNVSGFMTAFFLFRSNDEYIDNSHDVTATQVSISSEIYFDAEQTLANGHTIKAHIEMEAVNEGNNSYVDEAWLSISGSWGELRIGGEDGALNLTDMGTVGAGINLADGATWAAITGGGNNEGGVYSGITSDDNKVVYFTPRMSGVQLSASFTPDTTSGGPVVQGGAGSDDFPNDSGSEYTNVWDIAANVQHTWGDYKITVAGGIESGDADPANNNGDVTLWNAGVVLSSPRGALSFKYGEKDNDLLAAAAGTAMTDGTTWAVGGLVKMSNDVNASLTYFVSEADLKNGTTDEFSRITFGVDKAVAAGVTVAGFVSWEDYDAAAGSASDKDGVVGGVGMAINF